jgi:DNA-binding XRE family transcriptional regulator
MSRNPPRPDAAQARTQLDHLHAGLASGQIDIADAVRRMRHLSGLTQPEFAKHRSISVQALRQIETGKGNPTVATLDAIASVFGLKVGLVPNPRRP